MIIKYRICNIIWICYLRFIFSLHATTALFIVNVQINVQISPLLQLKPSNILQLPRLDLWNELRPTWLPVDSEASNIYWFWLRSTLHIRLVATLHTRSIVPQYQWNLTKSYKTVLKPIWFIWQYFLWLLFIKWIYC